MKKIPVVALSILLVFSNSQSAVAIDFTSPPANIANFEKKLNESLVEVLCSGVPGVGFSGNWSLSSSFKDSGFNSLILTTATATSACRWSNSSVFITYKGKRDNALINFWNGQTSDFANVKSRLTIPTLDLWDSELPKKNWWVHIVQNVPGFGLVWNSSTIRLVNTEKVIFTVDSIVPYVTDNALVFNNQGAFLGVVSSFGAMQPQGQLIVQGAPLQCQLSKANSSPTITNCGKFASEIWKDSGTASEPNKDSSTESDAETEENQLFPQYISHTNLKKSYRLGTKTLLLTARSDSGLQVLVDSQSPSVCNASIKKKFETFQMKLMKTGVCRLILSQDGDSDYDAAESISLSFRITR